MHVFFGEFIFSFVFWADVDVLANLAIKMDMKTLTINHKPDDVCCDAMQ